MYMHESPLEEHCKQLENQKQNYYQTEIIKTLNWVMYSLLNSYYLKK